MSGEITAPSFSVRPSGEPSSAEMTTSLTTPGRQPTPARTSMLFPSGSSSTTFARSVLSASPTRRQASLRIPLKSSALSATSPLNRQPQTGFPRLWFSRRHFSQSGLHLAVGAHLVRQGLRLHRMLLHRGGLVISENDADGLEP